MIATVRHSGIRVVNSHRSKKMEDSVDRTTEQFIHDQNIHRYRRLLWRVTDEGERLVLLELLADEKAKQMDRRLAQRA